MKSLVIKCLLLTMIISSLFFATSCKGKETLLFLNWGEYINDDLVAKFEEEYNCNVVIDLTDSNELFYAKLKSGTTAYDLTCPGDYMIQKMYDNNLIQEIDLSKLTNYDRSKFISTLNELMDDLEEQDKYNGLYKYYVPYFWGTFGLLYNKRNTSIKNTVESCPKGSEWSLLFDKSVLGENAKRGMYNVARFSFASSMLYMNLNPNSSLTLDASEFNSNLNSFTNVLNNVDFNMWGTDTLKKAIEAGNCDIAFAYSGDCLDMVYTKIADGVALEDMTFDLCVPENTILHCDSLVIPSNARHYDLALKFIDFMLDPDNAYENASIVGYCTPLQETYEMIVNRVGITPDMALDDPERFSLENWAKVYEKYYPEDNEGNMLISGKVLNYFSKQELTACENIVTQAKARN